MTSKMNMNAKQLVCLTLFALCLGLPAISTADGVNSDGFRLSGASMDRWAGDSQPNEDGNRVQQTGRFDETIPRSNADGYVLGPAPIINRVNLKFWVIIDYLLGLITLSPQELVTHDINADGVIDIADPVDLLD